MPPRPTPGASPSAWWRSASSAATPCRCRRSGASERSQDRPGSSRTTCSASKASARRPSSASPLPWRSQEEGLGGAKTVRGVLKNRFVGRGLLVWNAELRWRLGEVRLLGFDVHYTLTGFFDQGRVWEDGVAFSELMEELHRGYGLGLRVGTGQNFVVAIDGGRSAEDGTGIYIGLGYLF